jgi:hypothetical protein
LHSCDTCSCFGFLEDKRDRTADYFNKSDRTGRRLRRLYFAGTD